MMNWFSIFTFYWLGDFLSSSLKKTLELKDLLVPSEKRSVKFTSHRIQGIMSKNKSVNLTQGLKELIGFDYFKSMVPKLISDIMNLSHPYVLYQIIHSLESGHKNLAILYTMVLFLTKSLAIICDTRHRYMISKLADIKYMKISTCNQNDSSSMMNVMHLDVYNIQILLRKSNDLWSSLLTIFGSCFMIYSMLGASAIIQVIMILILIPINYYIQNNLQALQKVYRKWTDLRIQMITQVINGIQLMKLFAYEKLWNRKVTELREEEINTIKSYQAGTAYMNSFWQFIPYLISLLCFSGYSMMGNTISVGKSFAVFSLFVKITEPSLNLPGLVLKVKRVLESIKNIEKFLSTPEFERVDKKLTDPELEIDIKNADFTWVSELNQLQDITMSVKKGELIAVVGKVGSGKSSLLLSILGEMIKTKGDLNVSGRKYAYLPQKPWIDNGTIRENILFGKSMDQDLFTSVIHDCDLTQDFVQLSNGVETMIGSKGINLSGGQKVRVGLARCVYQKTDSDIFLLDDPLAAVDTSVGEHLLKNVIFGSLKEKTRIIATHHLFFLDKVDRIIVMENGKIEEQGTYAELIQRESSFKRLLIDFNKENHGNGHAHIHSVVKQEGKKVVEKKKKEALPPNTFYDYVSFNGLSKFIIFLAFIVLEYSSNSVSDWWLTKWSKDTNFVNFSLRAYISLYILSGILKLVISLTCSWIGVSFVIETARSLHQTMLYNIIHAKPAFFDDTPAGRIISVFNEDTHAVDTRLGTQLVLFLHSIISILVSFFVIVYLAPMFALLFVPIGFLYWYISSQCRPVLKDVMRIHSTTYHAPFTHFKSCMTGLHTIRAFEAADRLTNENEALLQNHMGVLYTKTLIQEWFHLRVELVGVLITVLAAMIGILYTNDSSALRLLLSTCTTISTKLFGFVTRGAQTESGLLCAAMMMKFINTESEDYEGKEMVSDWPSNGELVFEKVHMKYKKDLPDVLKGIDFKIQPKEKIGIAGRTGAGKSSLIYALFHLREVEGVIRIDDVDISRLPVDQLRKHIGIIQQEPVLITGTLRENLDPEMNHKDQVLWKALEQASMRQKVESVKDGLECQVGEAGKNFSRGERQLICLARVILKQPKILVMDEATSAIDMETDAEIQKSIRENFRDATVLTIAHRLQTITDSDRILVIDQGRVLDFDTPKVIGGKYPHFEEFIQ